MKTTLKYEIYNCYQEYDQYTQTERIDKWPSQVLICVSQIKWTNYVTECLSQGGIYDLPEYSNLLQVKNFIKNKIKIKLCLL